MQPIKSQKSTIFTLAFVIFIDSLTLGLVIPIFAMLFNDPQGILPATASIATRNLYYALIISLPMFALLFGSPILGELSDRHGRKVILLWSLLGVALSCILSVFSLVIGSVLVLFISRIMVSMMDGSQAIAQAAIIDISSKKDKTKNISMITLGSILGFIIGPLAGGILADKNVCAWFTYQTPFWFAAIVSLINFFMLNFIFKETRKPSERRATSWGTVFMGLLKGFVDKRYVLISIAFITIQFVWGGVIQASTILLTQRFHYTSLHLGLFMTYISFSFVFFIGVVLQLLLKVISPVQIARIGLLLVALGMFIFMLGVNKTIVIWLALIPIAGGVGLFYNSSLTLFSDSVGENEQGKMMGITVGLTAIGWLFSGLYIGHLSTVSYALCFAGMASFAVVSFIILLIYKEKT